MISQLPEKQSHNTHHFETVTVYYRWHPLAGKNLRVHKRQKDRYGEYIFVRLPDDTICGLPAWMFNVACAEFVIGTPFISIEALTELRDLLGELRASPLLCDMASVKEVLTEVPNEASAAAGSSAIQPTPDRSHTNRTAKRQKRRTRSRAGRTVTQRSNRKRRSERDKRRSG
jgi:hypothetical protein